MDLQDVLRKYFRFNVEGNSDFSVKINEVPYQLVGLANSGIGITLTSEDILLSVGDELPIELKAKDQVYTLQGKIVHISPKSPENYLCGLQFVNVDQDIQTKWEEFLQSYREKMFKDL